MEYRRLSRSLLFCLVLEVILLKALAQTSITARKPSATVAEGSSLTLEWDFSLQSSDSLREIVFGLWEKGYTSSFFITVTQSRGAVVNPELSKKHPSYVGRVFWVGNISRSYAAFRLVNARLSDSKTYGCQLGVGGFGQTRDSKMSLVVEKSSLDGKGSAFLHVPLARVGIVGQIAEFEWEYQYDTGIANGGDVKIVQFSKRSNPQTKPRILWKFQDNVNTTIPEYAERLLVSKVRRNEQEKYPVERYIFKLFKVNTNDEGDYELRVGFTNKEMDLDSRVFLDVHGKDIN
ncbi:uncharacterized protein [Porites lutea]|uniref:uncharacterized protein n=1 Tax=Porites lutea TaxID=51062 RepID=UPI003CC6623F